ncbi:hypothetical protein B0H13DRAFT_2303377 [Mycena leptocephala]|nr:hypothetical protein B0H13DRAFT_2303377 [Mycena leptocephala]
MSNQLKRSRVTPGVDLNEIKQCLRRLNNSTQLLTDYFVRNGFKTIVPDILNDDPVPKSAEGAEWDRVKWFSNYGPQQIRHAIDNIIAALKEEGMTGFGAV